MARARRALTYLVNGTVVVVVAAGIFAMLANIGVIARPVSQTFTLGG